MGACCCCCIPGRTEDPGASEELEHVPLSSQHSPVPAFSSRLLVDTNLDTSIPDTYRPPPIPMPYATTLGHAPISLVSRETADENDTDVQTTNSGSAQETSGGHAEEPSVMSNMNECDTKFKIGQEVEISKSVESIVLDFEDSCPICLEEYDKENPKLITKCDHHFHLACILEWMERSNTCPVCGQEMIFDPPID